MWQYLPVFITHNLLFQYGSGIIICLSALFLTGILLRSTSVCIWTILLFSGAFLFFRNPVRSCPEAVNNPHILVCPADGTIVNIAHIPNNEYACVVSIFLSLLDAHVMWIAYPGIIESITYTPGLKYPAFLAKSSESNEHNDVVLITAYGAIKIRQIAGIIARRICWWINQGQTMALSESYGMIRFGSRVDIFLPAHIKLAVSIGQQVYGGETILGYWQPSRIIHEGSS